MNPLQILLQGEKSTDELYSWGFAFQVTDGRAIYGDPIYKIFLDAFAKSGLTGQVLFFAADVLGVSAHPIYLVQMIPVTRETEDEARGLGFKEFETFRDLMDQLSAADPGMNFLKESSEIGYAMDAFASSILLGCIDLESGVVTRLKRTNSVEKSLFEQACLARYPGAKEDPADKEEA
jgi:hypothetical protein